MRAIFKKIANCILAILFLSTQTIFESVYSQNHDTGIKKYSIKSGMIEYEMKGISKGTQKVYFDQWGQKEATFTSSETEFIGEKTKSNVLVIITKEWIYNIDMDELTGTRSKNLYSEESLNKKDKDLASAYSKEMLRDMEGEKIGTEKILGKECEIWEIKKMGTKSWIWNGLTLKTTTNIAGMVMDMTALRLEENIKVPEEKFKVPDGVRIKESRIIDDNINK